MDKEGIKVDIREIKTVIERIEQYPQSHANWRDAIKCLDLKQTRCILRMLIDYGKDVPIRSVEKLITVSLKNIQ